MPSATVLPTPAAKPSPNAPAVRRATIADLRDRAARTGLLLAVEPAMFRTDDNDRQVCRVVAVRRLRRRGGHVIRYPAEADLDECFRSTPSWWDNTRATLAEVAEARALRAAFPELAGLLTVDEPEPESAAVLADSAA